MKLFLGALSLFLSAGARQLRLRRMAQPDEEPFYSAYGKISSRFGAEDGAELAEELSAASIGPDGPSTAAAKVKTAPTETLSLIHI